MTRFLLILITALATGGCGDNPATPSPRLEGTSWRLVSLQRGAEIVAVPAPDRYTVRFEDGRAAVRSDCNSCGGSYTVTGTTLDIGPLVCTRVFCGPDSLDIAFTRALDGAASALASGDTLVVHGGDVSLRFSR